MPKILLTNHHLMNYGGSELVTLDLATEFQQRGWNVTVATFRFGAGIEQNFNARGIQVVNVLNQSLPESEFDLVWSHHYPVLIKCLVEDCVKTKFLILSSLSPYEPLEAIPFFHSQSDLILCNSEETKKEILEYNNRINFHKNQIFVFKNSVPSDWFQKNLHRRNSKLIKIAIISNHPPTEILDAREILKSKQIDIDLIGISGNTKLVNIDVLSSYDAVITIGRTVQHCMALGIPVFCYDHFGGPGWLNPNNFQLAEWFNYSGRCCYQRFESEELVNNLINGFIESQKYISFFSDYAVENYSLTKNVETTLDYISSGNWQSKEYLSFNSEQIIGKVGKAYRRIFIERENLQQELEQSQSQLQQTQGEFEQSQFQLQQTQAEFERSQSQLQQIQAELEQSQFQLQQTQDEFKQSQFQLQQTQTELEQSQLQQQQAQTELERLQSQLPATHTELEQSQLRLQQTQAEVKLLQNHIRAMESSKFWKLRSRWFGVRDILGLTEKDQTFQQNLLIRVRYFWNIYRVKGLPYVANKVLQKSIETVKYQDVPSHPLPNIPQSDDINYPIPEILKEKAQKIEKMTYKLEAQNLSSDLENKNTNSKSLSYQQELPFIDISIVTYNSVNWIDIFFASLITQSYPTKLINIFITDNNSTDDTLKKCSIFLEKYSDKFHDFQVFKRPNLGFGCGHNYNLCHSSSPYFLVSNIDLEFASDAIYQVVNTAIHDSEDVASWELRQKPFEHPKYYNPVTLETSWSSSACILFRRSAIEKVKGYEEKIFLYGEDVEISYRLRDNGFVIKYCPKAVCWHYTYEEAQQVKPLQFFGSILANSYLRIRYGSLQEIIEIPLMYGRLLLSKKVVNNQRIGLLINIFKLLKNSTYFFRTRKQSKNLFPFRKWDYELIRDGAFYRYRKENHPTNPLVSVIIRTYQGRLSFLREAVTSVLNQTYQNIELIVVEDGSNTAKDYIENITISNIKIKYLSEPKRGRCGAGNAGLANTTGDFIVFLDDDDLFFAEHLEILVDDLLAHPEIAATYSIAWEVKTKLISTEPLIYEEVSHDTIYRQPFCRPLMWHHNYIPIQTILFRRKLYENYGGFDEELDCLEDWNLWTRYCIKDDFLLIEKTTSLYRVPYDKVTQTIRQQNMDSYYSIAANKQKELSLTVNPLDIMKFHNELNSYQQSNIFLENWKSRLKKNQMFINIYLIIKKKRLLFWLN